MNEYTATTGQLPDLLDRSLGADLVLTRLGDVEFPNNAILEAAIPVGLSRVTLSLWVVDTVYGLAELTVDDGVFVTYYPKERS